MHGYQPQSQTSDKVILVLGPKMSGKTTLLKALDDREIDGITEAQSAGLSVLYLHRYEFQVQIWECDICLLKMILPQATHVLLTFDCETPGMLVELFDFYIPLVRNVPNIMLMGNERVNCSRDSLIANIQQLFGPIKFEIVNFKDKENTQLHFDRLFYPTVSPRLE